MAPEIQHVTYGGGQVVGHEKDARWRAVDDYAISHLHQVDAEFANGALPHALRNSTARGLPAIEVSPTQGKSLFLQAKLLRPRRILEVGTLGAYSTLWLARSLLADGDTKQAKHPAPPKGFGVVTLESNDHHADVAQQNIDYAGLTDYVEIIRGPAIESLKRIEQEAREKGPFQLVFIDADKENNLNYFNAAVRLCAPGSLIIVDNVVRMGKLASAEEASDPRVKGSRELVEAVGKDSRVAATVIQTVSDKNYDGYLMAFAN